MADEITDHREDVVARAIESVWPDMNGVTLRRAARAVLAALAAHDGESAASTYGGDDREAGE
jgi:hypothetical protein